MAFSLEVISQSMEGWAFSQILKTKTGIWDSRLLVYEFQIHNKYVAETSLDNDNEATSLYNDFLMFYHRLHWYAMIEIKTTTRNVADRRVKIFSRLNLQFQGFCVSKANET